jgi:hypothetical protein
MDPAAAALLINAGDSVMALKSKPRLLIPFNELTTVVVVAGWRRR